MFLCFTLLPKTVCLEGKKDRREEGTREGGAREGWKRRKRWIDRWSVGRTNGEIKEGTNEEKGERGGIGLMASLTLNLKGACSIKRNYTHPCESCKKEVMKTNGNRCAKSLYFLGYCSKTENYLIAQQRQ